MKFSVTALLGLANMAMAQLQQVSSFGDNPSGAKMFIHVPSQLAEKPAIIVAIHYCTGTAQAYYSGSPYASLADQKGFIVIYPESPYSGTCWDVSSKATLTHEGGANSNSIANMVRYTLDKYNADPDRVFVTGSSSGAMMTVSLVFLSYGLGHGADPKVVGVERPRGNISRHVRGRHRLLGSAGRMLLHQLGQRLELVLRQRSGQWDARTLGSMGV